MASSSNSSRFSSRQRFIRSCTNVSLVPVGFISKICRIVIKSIRSHMSHNSATTYRQVFKRFLKISLWSTYFVYVRTPKTRGFPEVFQRFLILGFWSTFFVYFRCNPGYVLKHIEKNVYGIQYIMVHHRT